MSTLKKKRTKKALWSYSDLDIRKRKPNRIAFGHESITVSDEHGEIAYWDVNKWIEDPRLVFAIANAALQVGRQQDRRR